MATMVVAAATAAAVGVNFMLIMGTCDAGACWHVDG